MNTTKLFIISISTAILSATCTMRAEARLYHAVEQSLAKRVIKQGINPAKLKLGSRFGKGFYLSRQPSTALAEKGSRSAVIRFRESSMIKNKAINMKKPNRELMQKFLGKNYDLRGAYKNNVIGPKAGRKIGSIAGRSGRPIQYRSVKNGKTNVAIPVKALNQHPRIVSPERIVK